MFNPIVSYKCLIYRRTPHWRRHMDGKGTHCLPRFTRSKIANVRQSSSRAIFPWQLRCVTTDRSTLRGCWQGNAPCTRTALFGTAVVREKEPRRKLRVLLSIPGECAATRLFGFCDDWTAHTLLSFYCHGQCLLLRSVFHSAPLIFRPNVPRLFHVRYFISTTKNEQKNKLLIDLLYATQFYNNILFKNTFNNYRKTKINNYEQI